MQYCFQNLVFEGGGVKGIAYGGALLELEKLGLTQNIKRVAGTSAGAITACLIAVGYNGNDIAEIIGKTNFKNFQDDTFGVFRDIKRLFREFGWNKGESFTEWIGELIEAKTGNPNLTFQELVDKGFKELYVACSNITKQRAEILSHETTPDLSIGQAVRMSMSIPIFFAAVKNSEGDVIVDGGVTMNYPINIFDNVKYLSNPDNGIKISYDDDQCILNYETLGFRVDSIEEKNYLEADWKGDPSLTKNLKNYIGALLSFMMEIVNKRHLSKNDWNRTIFIDSGDISAVEFSLSNDKVKMLVENGKLAVNDYFRWRNSDSRWSVRPY